MGERKREREREKNPSLPEMKKGSPTDNAFDVEVEKSSLSRSPEICKWSGTISEPTHG